MSDSAQWALWVLLAAQPTVQAGRTTQPPAIDGRLDDPSWQTTPEGSSFRQIIPFDGADASEKTRFRVLYDDAALYVGVDCDQVGAPLVGRLTRRDQDSESEWITLQIDPRAEGKVVLAFAVNIAGVLVDAVVSQPYVWNTDWDENWEARAVRTTSGWSAEFRIPFRVLRFDASRADAWGFQVTRYIAQKQETDYWSYAPRADASPLVHFGRLDGLRNLKPPGVLELRPFVTADVRRLDATSDTTASGYASQLSVGLDLKLHLTPDLIIDGAVRPDFGQVEADQIVLNLTNYETFFPEKRSLFLEGGEVLSFPLRVFYSRRIGFAPDVPALRTDINQRLVNPPQPATIHGAVKLVGRLGSNWVIGSVNAITGRNEVTVQDESGQRTQLLVAPLTGYNVLRLKREWGSRGHVGVIATSNSALERDGGYPVTTDPVSGQTQLCPSGVLVLPGTRCFRDSYVSGIDGLWRSPSGQYVANAAVVGSVVHDGAPSTRLDGSVIGSGAKGLATSLRLAKEGGKHLLASVSYFGASRKLDYNDLGYMPRQNVHDATASVGLRTLEPDGLTLDKRSAIQVTQRRSLSGLDLGQNYELNGRLRFRNHWTVSAALDVAPARLDDRETGDGNALERAGYWGARLDFNTNPGRRAVLAFSTQGQRIRNHAWSVSAQATLTVTPLPQLEISLWPQVGWSAGEWRYTGYSLPTMTAGQPADPVFGKLATANVGATLRVSYTFAPRVSLQTYAQAFLAAGHFAELRALAADGSRRFLIDALEAAPSTSLQETADFEKAALNLNVVFRWEYHLGSTLFLVYSRSQVPDLANVVAPASLQPRALGARSSADVILVKLGYWWAS